MVCVFFLFFAEAVANYEMITLERTAKPSCEISYGLVNTRKTFYRLRYGRLTLDVELFCRISSDLDHRSLCFECIMYQSSPHPLPLHPSSNVI